MMRTILHVDMDAFYASIEQRDRPELAGRPVVVGADPKGGAGRGVVAAASYEARAFGIHSAQPIAQAYRLCPDAHFLPVDMDKYVAVSKRIFAILGEYTDLVEPLSIDEAFLDVTASRRLHGDGRAIALAIKGRIVEEESLRASVGIAPNKFLAKVASDLEKPDGLVEVRPGEEQAFLDPLPVERLWGVGPRTAEALHRLGIRRIGELRRRSPAEMRRRFGRHGEHLVRLAEGRDDRPVCPEREPKSVGQERTFDVDTDDERLVRATILALADRVALRLGRAGLLGRTVTLKFRDGAFRTETRSRTLPDATADADAIGRTALALLGRIATAGRKVRLVGVAVAGLEPSTDAPRQLSLFAERERRRAATRRSLDELAARFGEGVLKRGVEIDTRPARPAGPHRVEP